MKKTPWIAVCVMLSVVAVSTAAVSAEPARWEQGFDSADALQGLAVSGDVSVDASKDRGGSQGMEAAKTAPAGKKQGALRLGPGGKAVWTLRNEDGTGVLELWVYEDGAKPANAREYGAGAMWGLMQADGHMAAVGAIYAPYLNGAETYAVSTLNPDQQKPWQQVTYLGIKRAPGWHKWVFDFDPDKGLRLLVDDQDVKNFNWNQSQLKGFVSVVLFGDATDAQQTLWVDDATVRLGPPARVLPVWPPPPPLPPADLTVLPPQAPWNPTPYAHWKNGPGKDENYFPIAVWLQDPKLAGRYKAAGINLYIGLWNGPTAEQLQLLRDADMPVICDLNDFARGQLDEPLFVGWMHGDEPDNAQTFAGFWKGDKEKIKEGWPEIYQQQGLAKRDYRGYGPPVPPAWIVRDYEQIKTVDATRPAFLGLGQGVAWEKYHGRGERTGHLEDYAQYLAGCDIACFDIYPAAHDNLAVKDALWYVPRGVRRLREWRQDTKPVWVHLETGVISAPGAEPTPQQVKAEVWMALIHGARGIDYFVHQFKPQFNEHALLDNPDMLAAVTAVNRQVAALAPVLNSPPVVDGVVIESTNPRTPVHAIVKRKAGATYVFSAALYGEETNATFRVQGLAGNRTAEAIGEDRTLRVQDGVFSDAFTGNGVHLYRIADGP